MRRGKPQPVRQLCASPTLRTQGTHLWSQPVLRAEKLHEERPSLIINNLVIDKGQ